MKYIRKNIISAISLYILCTIIVILSIHIKNHIVNLSIFSTVIFKFNGQRSGNYWVVDYPTSNITLNKKNLVEGIVLHHTACSSIMIALNALAPKNGHSDVSCHVVIDTDGTRYILASSDQITWHAGASSLNGKDDCNNFTIGIEFQGNTLEKPLTAEQIESAVEYMLPIIHEYKIPIGNVVTHEQIRRDWIKSHTNSMAFMKHDITESEYKRLISVLNDSLTNK